MVTPKPQDPRVAALSSKEIQDKLTEVLARPADTLAQEAVNLEEAYRILNEALT